MFRPVRRAIWMALIALACSTRKEASPAIAAARGAPPPAAVRTDVGASERGQPHPVPCLPSEPYASAGALADEARNALAKNAGERAVACARAPSAPAAGADQAFPGETRLRNVRQLTFGGENAEAYFSFDGKELVFQSTRGGRTCDQEFVMRPDGSGVRRVSTGQGIVTCGYFFPDGSRIVYASTHESMGPDCPPKPDRTEGYVWALYDYQLYTARPDGTDLRPLAPAPGSYNAEATISKDGWMVFTSTRDGDLDLYSTSTARSSRGSSSGRGSSRSG